MPELRTAQENARLEIGSQRGRNSHQINFWVYMTYYHLLFPKEVPYRGIAPGPRGVETQVEGGPRGHRKGSKKCATGGLIVSKLRLAVGTTSGNGA